MFLAAVCIYHILVPQRTCMLFQVIMCVHMHNKQLITHAKSTTPSELDGARHINVTLWKSLRSLLECPIYASLFADPQINVRW